MSVLASVIDSEPSMWLTTDQRQKPWMCYDRGKSSSLLLGVVGYVAWDSYKIIFLPRRKPALEASAHRPPPPPQETEKHDQNPDHILVRPALLCLWNFQLFSQFESEILLLAAQNILSHTKLYCRLGPGP